MVQAGCTQFPCSYGPELRSYLGKKVLVVAYLGCKQEFRRPHLRIRASALELLFLPGNHHHSTVEFFNGIDQSIDRFHVQMVCGFVQVNQVRPQVKNPKQAEATTGVSCSRRSLRLKGWR